MILATSSSSKSVSSSTNVMGLFALVNGVISIAIMAAAALVTGQPFIFPSLGPTAFLLFYTPLLAASCPRNTLGGHAIGAAAGYLALVVFGLTDAAPALATSVTGARVGAAALSLGLTSGAMVWARVPHPPAGATTLIVSLGIFHEPRQLVLLMLAQYNQAFRSVDRVTVESDRAGLQLLPHSDVKVRGLIVGEVTVIDKPSPNPQLIVLLRDARLARILTESKPNLELDRVAKLFGRSTERFKRLLRLSYLSPTIVDAIIGGNQPARLTNRFLQNLDGLPLSWPEQEALLLC